MVMEKARFLGGLAKGRQGEGVILAENLRSVCIMLCLHFDLVRKSLFSTLASIIYF